MLFKRSVLDLSSALILKGLKKYLGIYSIHLFLLEKNKTLCLLSMYIGGLEFNNKQLLPET